MSLSNLFLPKTLEDDLNSSGLNLQSFYERVYAFRNNQYPRNRVPSARALDDIVSTASVSKAASQQGLDAITSGKTAVSIINGGMATRFGGIVKGLYEVLEGHSFLELHFKSVQKIEREYSVEIPIVMMNSPSTNAQTTAFLKDKNYFGKNPDTVFSFVQSQAPRLTKGGNYVLDDMGNHSMASSGHGDFYDAIASSKVLDSLKERGIEYLFSFNVDNLGAHIDPTSLGHMLSTNADMLAEFVENTANNTGGFPAVISGRKVILEWFCLPFNMADTPPKFINTNNIWFKVEHLNRPIPLQWFMVEKTVGEEKIMQFERVISQFSWFCDCEAIHVPQDSFIPAKTIDQVTENHAFYKQILSSSNG